MAKYRVKRGARVPYNDGEQSRVAVEGDEIELAPHVAADVANRWMLEPLDDQARYSLMPDATVDPHAIAISGAAHERVQALQGQLDALDAKREAIVKQLDAAKAEQDAAAEKMTTGAATAPGEMINGVPVRVINPGDGQTTAGVVHGEPTKLTPGDGGTVTAGSDPVPQQPNANTTAPGVQADPPPQFHADASTRQPAAPQQG